MKFLIADAFTSAFNRLSGQDQKAVKASVFDLQMDPSGMASSFAASIRARIRTSGRRGSIAMSG